MSKDFLYPLRRLHGKIHDFKSSAWPIIRQRWRRPNAVFLILTPEHDNLGDQALAQAETEMLDALGVEYIELTGKMLQPLYENNWLNVMNGRTILFNGGGYLGTIWLASEQMVRKVLQQNPKSTICILPNTVYYEDSDTGKAEKEMSAKLYGEHPDLYLYAREAISYELMCQLYQNVKLVPDMVLSMNKCEEEAQRTGCLLCLRNDREKTRTDADEQGIIRQMQVIFGDGVARTDMQAGYDIPPADRAQELEKKFAQFRSARLVITDRLHGMIFCAITGTPCIVVDSKSPKVKGCYAWMKNLEYIRFADHVSEITEIWEKMQKTDCHFDNAHLQPYYEDLKADILRFAGKSESKR